MSKKVIFERKGWPLFEITDDVFFGKNVGVYSMRFSPKNKPGLAGRGLSFDDLKALHGYLGEFIDDVEKGGEL